MILCQKTFAKTKKYIPQQLSEDYKAQTLCAVVIIYWITLIL